MNWIKTHQRSALICCLTLLLPALLYLNVLFGALGLRSEYVSDIENLEPRIARLQGLKEYEEQLQSSSVAVQQQATKLAYPVTADKAGVAANLQADIRQLMTDAGLSVSNSQVLPVREEEKFDYIGVKLTVDGDVAALDAALAELANVSPVIVVESLDVWPKRSSRRKDAPAVQEITASIRLLSLRAVI